MTVKRLRGRRGEINGGTPRNKCALHASQLFSFGGLRNGLNGRFSRGLYWVLVNADLQQEQASVDGQTRERFFGGGLTEGNRGL
jgi:hypothetical protein